LSLQGSEKGMKMSPKTEYTVQQSEDLKTLAREFPERAKMAQGQSPNSVFFRAPADAPHNVDKMYESGLLLKHPSGRFVRP
jgi:hypothetical protein